jgi:hypothetical protein
MSRQDQIAQLTGTPPLAVRGQETRDAKAVRSRLRGVFNGTNKKLDVQTQIPGYHLHWMNDERGRIELAIQGGYDYVAQDEVVLPETNRVLETNSALDGKIRRLVGSTERGDPLYAYLLKIKQEWYDEDQADLAAKVRESNQTLIRQGGAEGGASNIPNSYVPKGKKQALEIGRGST